MNTTIKFDLEYITPDVARAMLARSEQAQQQDTTKRQRTTKVRAVAALRGEVKAGNFHATHQAMAIDPAGWVFDGKHRLTAIAQESVGAHIYVARYACEEYAKLCMRFLDVGLKRDLGGTLEACGKIDRLGDEVIAAVRAIWLLRNADRKRIMSSADVDDMLRTYADEILHIRDLAPKFGATVIGSFAFARASGAEIDGLLTRIYAGVGLSEHEAKLRTIVYEGPRGRGGPGERREYMGRVLRLLERIQLGDKITKSMSVDVNALVARWDARMAG